MFSSSKKTKVPPERRPIGMVFQSYAIWPHLSVFENVAYPLRVDGQRRTSAELRSRVTRLADRHPLYPDLTEVPR